MNKVVFPALLVATIMVAGAFAFVPVEQASTVHLSGTTLVVQAGQDLSADGAVSILTLGTNLDTTGGAIDATLADGTAGQIKIITMVIDGGTDVILTPLNLSAGSTITFDSVLDSVILTWDSTGWIVVINTNVVVA